MLLVYRHLPDCPAWYDLPEQGVPDILWMWGSSEPTMEPEQQLAGRAVVMDHGHDYRIEGDRYRYMYTGGTNCWVIFQYGTELSTTICADCQKDTPTAGRFCQHCGSSLGTP